MVGRPLSLMQFGVAALRALPPERAHQAAIAALASGLISPRRAQHHPDLAVQALGLTFANPLGLAAGFDKDGRAIGALAGLGWGFVEAGTVTPRPQPGNPRPRLFRLAADRALINRMGFNNAGAPAFLGRLRALPSRPVPIGANIGINKEGADPLRDYPALVAMLGPVADYLVLNVSSPNTPGLRALQDAARLREVLRAIAVEVPTRPPLLVKLAPDLAPEAVPDIVRAACEAGIEGLIVSNTTTARPLGLRDRHRGEAGGLSGKPLFAPSTDLLRAVARLAGRRLVLIGCGGIQSGADILAKLRAGASLVQLYTAFVYEGPGLLPRLLAELREALQAEGFASVSDAVGADLR